MAEILTYSSDKLTRLLARLKRKAGDSLTSKLLLRFTKDGFHAYRNDYKKSSIQGTHVTYPVGCTHALTVAHVPQVLEFTEKESDNLGRMIEVGNMYDHKHQRGRVYSADGLSPTLIGNSQGGGRAPNILDDKNTEEENDTMTNSLRYYDADDQADFTQTEAEEWATEIALRIKEGNLDPIPKNKDKQFEQYDFTYASLFSGIGGFEQALNKFGGECVFASEIDKFAAQAYETLYEHKPAGDITKIDAKDIPDHDLLVGGFPCQAFSVAGRRKGFEDTRGTLFSVIDRIPKEKQPKALLLETEKDLANQDKGRAFDVMI